MFRCHVWAERALTQAAPDGVLDALALGANTQSVAAYDAVAAGTSTVARRPRCWNGLAPAEYLRAAVGRRRLRGTTSMWYCRCRAMCAGWLRSTVRRTTPLPRRGDRQPGGSPAPLAAGPGVLLWRVGNRAKREPFTPGVLLHFNPDEGVFGAPVLGFPEARRCRATRCGQLVRSAASLGTIRTGI